MKKVILILISGLLVFGLDVSKVSAANRGRELNGAEIGGRKYVTTVSPAKAVKEVMDVYDKMKLKNFISWHPPLDRVLKR